MPESVACTIRVHLAKLQAPIVNDSLYGGADFYLSDVKRNFKLGKYEEEQPLIRRFALHAAGLKLETMKAVLEVNADYPKDLRVLIKQVGANARKPYYLGIS